MKEDHFIRLIDLYTKAKLTANEFQELEEYLGQNG